MKNYFFSLISLLTIYNIAKSEKTNYDYLLEWAKNNSIYISNKIGINYTNENTKNFYVKKMIDPGEILLSIPHNLLLNIQSALKLSSSKIKTEYKKYKSQKFKETRNKGSEIYYQRIDHSFLAYLMAKANEDKSPKNKLYQKYKYFFETCETNLDNYPLFFSTDQIRYFLFSLFGNEILETRKTFEEEYDTLQSQIADEELDLDDYIKYRLFTYSKIVNISGESSIVPFIDFFDTNPVLYNLKVNYSFLNQSLNVISNVEIDPKQKLLLGIVEMTNMASFIVYGKIYEEKKNFLESFKIPIIFPSFLREKNLSPTLYNGETIDLKRRRKFWKKAIPDYMKISKLLKGDGSSLSALKLFLENIESFRKLYDQVTISSLLRNFFDLKTAQNIKSVLDTEKDFLDIKIRQLQKIISHVATGDKKDKKIELKSDL